MQARGRNGYAGLLPAAPAALDSVADAVAADIAAPGEDLAALAAKVRPAVAWLVERLAAAPELSAQSLDELRREGARMALEGEPLQRMLDRYLSAGWVVWGAAAMPGADAGALAALGRALLLGLDRVAAAIGEGYSASERALAARTASARREYVDELLDLIPGDAATAARVRRRAPQFGLDPAGEVRVLVADIGRELDDGGPELERIERALERPARAERDGRAAPGAIVTTRRGRLVVLLPGALGLRLDVAGTLERLADGAAWRAALSRPVAGVAMVGVAHRDAVESLAAGGRAGRTGSFAADDVLLERALLADEDLARAAVDAELGPLLRAPRNAGLLLATLEAWLASGQHVLATARALDVAPRTVAYRLDRIAALLGRPLAGDVIARLASALLLRRLLGPAGPTAAAGPRPRAPRGRSRTRRYGVPGKRAG